jgi:hypothetical protein
MDKERLDKLIDASDDQDKITLKDWRQAGARGI